MNIFNLFFGKKRNSKHKSKESQISSVASLASAKYLIFDTETNGIRSDRVALQLAWLLADEKGQTLLSKSYILRQNVSIDPKALEIHGISQSVIKSKGVETRIVYNEFVDDLRRCDTIVGHNISFDIQTVKNDLVALGWDDPFEGKILYCTMNSSKEYVKAKDRKGYLKNPRLEELAGMLFYNDISKKFEGCHDALFDVQLTAKCFFELKRLEEDGKFCFDQMNIESNLRSYSTLSFKGVSPKFDVDGSKFPCINYDYYFPCAAGGACDLDSENGLINNVLRLNIPALNDKLRDLTSRITALSPAEFMNTVTSLSSHPSDEICVCEKCYWTIENITLSLISTREYKVDFIMTDKKGNQIKYQDILEIDNGVLKCYDNGYKFEKEGSIDAAIVQYSKMLEYPCELSDIIKCVERMSIMLSKAKRYDEVFSFIDKAVEKINSDYKGALNRRPVLSALNSLSEEREKRIRMSKRSQEAKHEDSPFTLSDYTLKFTTIDDLKDFDLPAIFNGKKVLITGNLNEINIYTRDEGNEAIVRMGGLPQKSVVKSIDFVVIGSGCGPSKIDKLKIMQQEGHNVKCIDPQTFKQLFECREQEPIEKKDKETKEYNEKIDNLLFETRTLNKFARLTSKAINQGPLEVSLTPEEFEYLKREGLVSDENVIG